jgi:hypothetical protein
MMGKPFEYSWATFIKAHLSAIAAGGFLHGRSVELGRAGALLRVLRDRPGQSACRDRRDLATPHGLWMEQVPRNLLDVNDGFLVGKGHLISDRGPLYAREFRGAMKRGGVDVLRLPPSSPNLKLSRRGSCFRSEAFPSSM